MVRKNLLLTFLDCIAKYKFTIISLMLLVLSVIIILNNAKVETRIETFLPGYKPGRPITEIDDPSVQNLVRMSLKFGDSARVSVIYESPVRLDKTGSLENLRRLHKKLENFENVQTVISILNYPGADLYIKNDALDLENLPKEYRSFISMDG